ncbi:MAG: DNA polymerase III subunit delta [Pyrinomonadaceae bacterium]|nr:DNA polymerase III subunit delta [Pyrinomonadaceae bacterium]
MTAISRTELERSLKEGRLAPVYLLVGCEGYLRDGGARAIADAALSETLLREFNESSFSLTSGGAQEAIAAANQLPMMSTRRVVKITDFGKLRDADEEALVRYISNPAESTAMIFNTADLDKRKKLARALLEKCQVVDYPALKDGDAKIWVKSRLKELKVACDDPALSEIIMLVGTDVQTLFSELDKLASASLPTRRITVEMVDDLIGRSRELSNWDLGDHLIARNRKQALETLHRLLDGGSVPVMLLGAIAGNFHRLALAKEALTHGSRDDVFRVVPLPSFKRDAFINNLRRSDAAQIAHGIRLIAAADLAIKTSVGGSGPKGARLQLEMLVCELSG